MIGPLPYGSLNVNWAEACLGRGLWLHPSASDSWPVAVPVVAVHLLDDPLVQNALGQGKRSIQLWNEGLSQANVTRS